ncbi:glycosyltransferase family 2 protein [Photobacterium leiognathi]|uniref:glycosyltransferase family 2 protein n=1 Tax=Photobacterium leiognathi TaxID=553611 RepID=UPI002980C3E3|nr:glycosyltransferase family 2 protein [Photobacterium leiognathi]
MVKVSVIFVSYNTSELTINAIKSVYEKTKDIKYEIILVDNNSHDNTILRVKEEFPNVVIYENERNDGFGAANNIGVDLAKGEYVFLLNTDTILCNNVIKILSDYLDENHDIVACGGNLYDGNLNPAASYSRLFPSIKLELNELLFNLTSWFKFFNSNFNYTDKPIVFKGSISGADSLIRKDAFKNVGGFDEKIFLYYEETDLFYRLSKLNHSVASVPSAKIIHLEGGSEQVKSITLERSLNSKYYYLNKFFSKGIVKVHHMLFNLTCFTRIIIFKIINNKCKSDYWLLLKKIENEIYYKRIK